MVTVQGNEVTFRFLRPGARTVELMGDFNDWRGGELRMVPDDHGYWQARVHLPAGTFRFRYRADGQWFTDFAAFGIQYGPTGADGVIHVAN